MISTAKERGLDFLAMVLALIIPTGVFGLLMSRFIFITGSDWTQHLQFAVAIVDFGRYFVIHVGFHWLVILLGGGTWQGMAIAGLVIGIVSIITTVIIVRFGFFGRDLNPSCTQWVRWLASLALVLVTPITVLTWMDENLYWGYIAINVDHNPTVILLRPFAIGLFLMIVLTLRGRSRYTPQFIAAVVLLSLISAFIKPNFILISLPAVIVFMGIRVLQRQETIRTNSARATACLIILFTLILAVQYALQFGLADSQEAGVALAPLAAIGFPGFAELILKLLMSIAFPLSVLVFQFRRALATTELQLSWLLFVFGAIQMHLLSETGERAAHGNFIWGAQIGLFILFLTSMRHLMNIWEFLPRYQRVVHMTVLALHVLSGAVYFLARLNSPDQSYLW